MTVVPHGRLVGVALAVLSLWPSSALSNEYWIAYEGNDLPENVGWTRYFGDEYGGGHGGAVRHIEDGAMVIDSLRNQMIYDFVQIHRQIDPDPGELFVATWHVLIAENYGYHDAGITIAPDFRATLNFAYYVDQIVSTYEGWSLPITAGAFHAYRIESTDMVHYRLWIDDEFARTGVWDLNSLNQSFVGWGDEGQGGGARSLSVWDYMLFGVVPEPVGPVVLLPLLACLVGRRR